MSTIAQGLPLTHGIEAARALADGRRSRASAGSSLAEALVGASTAWAGYLLLRFFELAEPPARDAGALVSVAAQVFWAGWLFHLKSLTLSGLLRLHVGLIEPLIIATLAFYMFKAGGRPGTLFYAALGAGVLGIWSSTLFGSGGAIQWQRWQGTLELLVAAPPPLFLRHRPAHARDLDDRHLLARPRRSLWGRLLFGIPFHLAHPWLFALALPGAIARTRPARPR